MLWCFPVARLLLIQPPAWVRYLGSGVGFDVALPESPSSRQPSCSTSGSAAPTSAQNAAMGYQACLNATDGPPAQGMSALGSAPRLARCWHGRAMKSGIGTASLAIGGV
jgi:L-aminopeptidase/D-esterase-like protein